MITVVAFGGNALSLPADRGRFDAQIERAQVALRPLVGRIAAGERMLLVHGNGPQVGHELLRAAACPALEPPPLDACVASTQGSMGYALELALRGELARIGDRAPVTAVSTLVRVDPRDPAMQRPDKPIGPFYGRGDAERMREHGLAMVEDAGRGYRRVVASPMPLEVIGVEAVHALLDAGHVVIAGGGGGVPVALEEDGTLRGVEAVIDKDHTAALLGLGVGAAVLIDLTSVEAVARDFGTARQAPLRSLSVREARALAAEGHFPPGSMGPKMEAACAFVEGGGDHALITSIEALEGALRGERGTMVVRRGDPY